MQWTNCSCSEFLWLMLLLQWFEAEAVWQKRNEKWRRVGQWWRGCPWSRRGCDGLKTDSDGFGSAGLWLRSLLKLNYCLQCSSRFWWCHFSRKESERVIWKIRPDLNIFKDRKNHYFDANLVTNSPMARSDCSFCLSCCVFVSSFTVSAFNVPTPNLDEPAKAARMRSVGEGSWKWNFY